MSGGSFKYNQRLIADIADQVEKLIRDNGRKLTEEELEEDKWKMDGYYERFPEEMFHHKYSDEVIDQFKQGFIFLRLAYIYAQRIDFLVSGDDGEETFMQRLEDDLNNLKDKL